MKRALFYTFSILEAMLFFVAVYSFLGEHKAAEATFYIGMSIWLKVFRLLVRKEWWDGARD